VGSTPNGETLFLWPFEMSRTAGIKALHWLGQKLSNYNLGLFAAEAAALTAGDVYRLLDAVARYAGAAAAIFQAQPFSWDGTANPFAQLPHQLAPNSGYAVTLGAFDALYEQRFSKRSRRILNLKERKLAAKGSLAYGWAETCNERLRLIDIFFAQKARQFAAQGVRDFFDAHARAFYRELALLEGDNPSRLRLGSIKVGDNVLATFSSTVCQRRLVFELASLAEGDLQRYSPGALLVRHQIKRPAPTGWRSAIFGAGWGAHKEQRADVVEPLFDSFIAFKPHGFALTLPLAALSRLKRAIKTSPQGWPVAQKLRARLFGGSAGA
jgi:CelD/BcsL family acetyltransferase involved in cellulose biosynthesis